MTEERKPNAPQPAPAQPVARDLKTPPRKEDNVQGEATRLADKVNANA
jgi:hypothetical protein